MKPHFVILSFLLFTCTPPGLSGQTIPLDPKPESGTVSWDSLLAEFRAHPYLSGFPVVKNSAISLNIGTYFSVRYLNQKGISDAYTNAFGEEFPVSRRHDIQIFKVFVYFQGHIVTPKFRYVAYLWSSNVLQGALTQTLVAGSFSYNFNRRFKLGVGILGLPGVRSVRNTFPFFNRVDVRTITDDFFRPSFTTGIWAEGYLAGQLYYKVALANNLSQFGVDAGQLDNGLSTFSGALWWSNNDYNQGLGTVGPYGDFEEHARPAVTVGASYTRSPETKQSQPGVDAPENSQIRLSDGTILFNRGAFAPGIQVQKATYHLSAVDAGLKYRGFSLDGEYYLRWVDITDVDNLNGAPPPDLTPVPDRLFDHGFQVQAGHMILSEKLQLYAFYGYLFGEYGDPWELGGGINFFPARSRALRLNADLSYVDRSPVGSLLTSYQVGATGPIFMMNLEWRW